MTTTTCTQPALENNRYVAQNATELTLDMLLRKCVKQFQTTTRKRALTAVLKDDLALVDLVANLVVDMKANLGLAWATTWSYHTCCPPDSRNMKSGPKADRRNVKTTFIVMY